MRRIAPSLFLFAAASAVPACAADLVGTQSGAMMPALVQGGDLWLAGLDGQPSQVSIPLTGEGGVFGWGQDYRLDAMLRPNVFGGYTAGIGATVGAMPGQPGGTYALRIGAGWLADENAFNLAGAYGLAPQSPTGDVNMSFTYSQSVTPALSFTGGAEAHHGLGGGFVDPTVEAKQVIVGAGVGLRF